MPLAEQSDATAESAAPVQPEPSVKTQLSTESQQTSSPIQEEAEEGDSSVEDGSGSGSDSGSSSESCDENEPGLDSSAGPVTPLEGSPDLPSRESLSVVQRAQVNQLQGSQKPRTVTPSEGDSTIKKHTPISSSKPDQVSNNTRTLKSLRDFEEQEIFPKWYRDRETSVLREALKTLGIKNNFEGFVEVVHAAADLIQGLQHGENHFKHRLRKQYERYCTDNPNGTKLTVAKFDDYLYSWAMKVWPCALDIIFKRIASSPKIQIYFVILTFEDNRCFDASQT